MTYSQFKNRAKLDQLEIYQEIVAEHRDSIKTKKETTAVKNLELIFEATLEIANRKGFTAMTMRDLSEASGLSMGALYDYFTGKEELLAMVQRTGRAVTSRLLRQGLDGIEEPVARLKAAIRTHIFLSEAMRPWFFFSYMEARHLGDEEKELAKRSELSVEGMIAEILRQGQATGVFVKSDPLLTAAVIKAMVQDWYLKRWKYAKRRVSVDRYANQVVDMVLAFCLEKEAEFAKRGGGRS
jgi:TetR/AcrR family transcriptional regulator, cholesterol catabolism regulator